jgi:hypothetical protein
MLTPEAPDVSGIAPVITAEPSLNRFMRDPSNLRRCR